MAEVLVSMLTGVTFYLVYLFFFLFSHSKACKASDANVAIIANSVCL